METKGMVYRKRVLVFILSILLLAISSSLAYGELNDQYSGKYHSKLNVKKWFHDKDVNYADVTFDPINNTFILSDYSGYTYTGTYSYIKKGKKVRFFLDDAGLQEMANMIIDWIVDYGASEGYAVTIDSLSGYVAIKDAMVPKAGKKLKVTVTAHGKVVGDVNGRPVTAKFSYKCNLTFTPY